MWREMIIPILQAVWIGLKDGWESPYFLSSGMTWDNPHLNEAYDHAVNVGQFLRSPLWNQRVQNWWYE